MSTVLSIVVFITQWNIFVNFSIIFFTESLFFIYYNTWRKLITKRKNSETSCEINLKKYLDFRWILAMIFSSKWIVCESCSETNWKKLFGWTVNHVSNSYGSFNIETHVNICYHVQWNMYKLGQKIVCANRNDNFYYFL